MDELLGTPGPTHVTLIFTFHYLGGSLYES